jgi:hypothetical protein
MMPSSSQVLDHQLIFHLMMDLDNLIIGKTKKIEERESWEKSSSCFGLRQFHHRQNKKEQLLPNLEVGGEEWIVGQNSSKPAM